MKDLLIFIVAAILAWFAVEAGLPPEFFIGCIIVGILILSISRTIRSKYEYYDEEEDN